jgi:putative ABC transport system substrate-binding protein
VRRREFIRLVSGVAATWPLIGHAQSVRPVVGLLSGVSPGGLDPLHRGLNEFGFVEGKNVDFEYRFAEGHYDRLPALAADLVNKHVTVIAAMGEAAAKAAQIASNSRIPIVFSIGDDPVSLGLVTSINRPSGNITGSISIGHTLGPKRVELLRELLPKANTFAFLFNPSQPREFERRDVAEKVRTIGLQLTYLEASSVTDFDRVFSTVVSEHIDGIIIANETFFFSEIRTLASFASRFKVPAIGPLQAFAQRGGLMSYGASIPEVIHQAGVYVGRVLNGSKPAELPVMQPSRFELVINLKTANALGLTVPETLLATADEVIQ